MNMEKAVGAELQACRRKKQISQEQLGFDAGVHRTYVSLIERGVKNPTLGVRLLHGPRVTALSPRIYASTLQCGPPAALCPASSDFPLLHTIV